MFLFCLCGMLPLVFASGNPVTGSTAEFSQRAGIASVKLDKKKILKYSDWVSKHSLDGVWKFSGLEVSDSPFGKITSNEMPFVAENFDDSQWKDVKVPQSWYFYPGVTSLFRTSDKKERRGDVDVRIISNPFNKGFLRRTFEFKKSADPCRIILNFDGLAYSADIFINGKFAGTHHGDYVSCKIDITDFIKNGKNSIALRILSDLTPGGTNRKFTRTYGCMWSAFYIRGGIWLPVSLDVIRGNLRFDELLLATDIDKSEITASYKIFNPSNKTVTADLAFGISRWDKNEPADTGKIRSVTLKQGVNTGTFSFKVSDVKLWNCDAPVLYNAFCVLKKRDTLLAMHKERIGFRKFAIENGKFMLNGKEIHLFFESAHSMKYGGHPTENGNAANRNPYKVISAFHSNGYNMLRTAHQPIRREFLEAADELGMLIYNEWSACFLRTIDETEFEKNNLPELERFIRTNHNHPSVVMWTGGNEVSLKREKAIRRQMDKQYDLIKRLDLQKRPVSSFAGMADLRSYGNDKCKTDFLDLHLYSGITNSWTLFEKSVDDIFEDLNKVYAGKSGKVEMPLVISEAIGGGWGLKPDPKFKLNNIDMYLKHVKRKYQWGNPGAAGYSGAAAVAHLLDPQLNKIYLQNTVGSRVAEFARQDDRINGFAPWFDDPYRKEAAVWNQPVMPIIRISDKSKFMIRQLFAPSRRELEFVVDNKSNRHLNTIYGVVYWENAEQQKIILTRLALPDTRAMSRSVQKFTLDIPENATGRGKITVSVFENDRIIGRNSYDVISFSQKKDFPALAQGHKIYLLKSHKALEKLLDKFSMPYVKAKKIQDIVNYRTAVIWGRYNFDVQSSEIVKNWINSGGVLLFIEPDYGEIPLFPAYKVVHEPNSFADIAIPAHNIFKEIDRSSFDTWAENPDGMVVDKCVIPLDKSCLLLKGGNLKTDRLGMALSENRLGKGRVLISTLKALNAASENSGAAAYMYHLLKYATVRNNTFYPHAPRIKDGFSERKEKIVCKQEQLVYIDMKNVFNRSCRDDDSGDGKGGWSDQGNNDYRGFPDGIITAAGVKFAAADKNAEKRVLFMKGAAMPQMPDKAVIPVNGKFNTFYFLHTALFAPRNRVCAGYKLIYKDNTSYDLPLISGKHIADWWDKEQCSAAFQAIPYKNGAGMVCSQVMQLHNPAPDKEVKQLEIYLPDTPNLRPVTAVFAVSAEQNGGACCVLNAAEKSRKATCGVENDPTKKVRTEAVWKLSSNPAGAYSMQIKFPSAEKGKIPFAIIFFGNRLQWKNNYKILSFLYRSTSTGAVDIYLPEKQWKKQSALIYNLDLGKSKGKWVRLRIDLERDCKTQGEKFPLSQLRREMLFFNGKDKSAGYPRSDKNFEITDIRFE